MVVRQAIVFDCDLIPKRLLIKSNNLQIQIYIYIYRKVHLFIHKYESALSEKKQKNNTSWKCDGKT